VRRVTPRASSLSDVQTKERESGLEATEDDKDVK
jgi:hypothetical protein